MLSQETTFACGLFSLATLIMPRSWILSLHRSTPYLNLCFEAGKGINVIWINTEASVEVLFKSHRDLGNTREPWFVNRNNDKL